MAKSKKSRSRSKKQQSLPVKTVILVGRGMWILGNAVFSAMIWTARKLGAATVKTAKKAKATHQKRKVQKQSEKVKQEAIKKFGDAKYQPFEVHHNESGELKDFEDRLHEDSLIIAVAGKRGSGKSSLGFAMLENVHANTKRPCAVLGVGDKHLPHWIQSVKDINQVKNDALVLVDEGAISFSSRASMSKKNKELAELLAIARHKNMTLILITQNTGMLDKNVLNLCDTVMLKQGSLLQAEMERPVIKKMYQKASPKISKLKGKKRKAGVYIIDTDFEGLITAQLPSFWSTNLSKNRS